MCIHKFSKILIFVFILFSHRVFAFDVIPENLNNWTEKGIVLSANESIGWEDRLQLAIIGAEKVGGTYYLFYLAGFDGCWNSDGDSNHQSVGLATSTDGINFTKYGNNPILKPHDFVSVGSEEEGIRTGYVRYLPSKGQFYGYFGVESPGGANDCPFGGGVNCGCNVGVDAAVFLATSSDGQTWSIDGQVNGTYAQPGNEVYASGWVFDGSTFHMYVTTAEGGQDKAASKGTDPLNLSELGGVPVLRFGWSGVDAFLHDDNNTVTLMYEPDGGNHPGSSNDNLYFATTYLNDMTTIEDERVITSSGDERNIIFKDGAEWKWYYSDEADEFNNKIQLRTHPIVGADSTAPSMPSTVTANTVSGSQIDITWTSASDPESGINRYKVYRNGTLMSNEPTTTSFSDTGLTEGATYSYEVSAVNGAQIEGAKSSPPISATTSADTTPPSIVSAAASGGGMTVVIVFDEPVELLSANDSGNYSINNGISISTASLGADFKTVTLATSIQVENVPYSLTVNNIKDRATTPNVIPSNTSVVYSFAGQLLINNLVVANNGAYEIIENGLAEGALVYIDRVYTFSGVPSTFAGATYIKTANDDKSSTGTSFLTFDTNQTLAVYIAHDDRIAPKPAWLDSYTDTGQNFIIGGETHSLMRKDFLSGTISLGGNDGSGSNMYAVIVFKQGDAPVTDNMPPAIPVGVSVE